MAETSRLSEFDGLRAIALLSVVLFHYFQRFPEFYPYGDSLLPVTGYGYLGVHLFFVISGFVISVSLRSGSGLHVFLLKRLLRLWPPLAVCAVITFIAMHLIDSAYSNSVQTGFSGFAASLSFIPPAFWRFNFGFDGYIDGVYWTLTCEVLFYLWAAVLFAVFGPRRFAERAALVLLAGQSVLLAAEVVFPDLVPSQLNMLMLVGYAHLFAAGVLFARVYSHGACTRTLALLGASVAVALGMAQDAGEAAILTLIYLIVAACAWRLPAARLLGWRPLSWIGLVSYSVYLLHNNIGITLLSLLPPGLPGAVYFASAAGVLGGIVLLSWGVFTWVEKPSQSLARRLGAWFREPRPAGLPDGLQQE
ncbi:acyltransferase [Leisingera sp. M658]|uniref:acyltransferase family protein n=1 Tax=Leisingera sp. M658 TaxID=2867015 RepID=UPI0021A61C43|nr:acyltransferase [Leisingera sp. M658]UWQ75611.1 acyltransferase [Leisingera sp. M658]